ncbi:MAG: cell shape determination protein CcmA [Polaromonas sp.]|nr:cell shape determination protein CcmA [Polaromonas sp.]
MFGKKKQPPIKSLIAQGTVMVGDIAFSEGLRIDGEVKGNVSAVVGQGSILVISETATVTGEVAADHIIVNGKVRGPVNAHDLLELQPKAQVEGDVTYKALEMHQGAAITGKLQPLLSGAAGADGEVADKPPLKLAANNR